MEWGQLFKGIICFPRDKLDIICNPRSVILPLQADLTLEGFCLAWKQTGSNKSCSHCKSAKKCGGISIFSHKMAQINLQTHSDYMETKADTGLHNSFSYRMSYSFISCWPYFIFMFFVFSLCMQSFRQFKLWVGRFYNFLVRLDEVQEELLYYPRHRRWHWHRHWH